MTPIAVASRPGDRSAGAHAVDGLVATFIASPRSRMPRRDVIDVMGHDEVDRWLAGYVEAWRTNDRERIAALFSADAKYRFHPYDEWVCGREAIVSSWLGESDAEGASTPDQPGTWEAEYRTSPLAYSAPCVALRCDNAGRPCGSRECRRPMRRA